MSLSVALLLMCVCSKPPASGGPDLRSVSGTDGRSATELFAKAKPLYDSKDYAACAPLMRAAADKGHPEAQMHLGKMYFNGWGVPHSHDTALEWHRKAAAQGNEESRRKLHKMGGGHDHH